MDKELLEIIFYIIAVILMIIVAIYWIAFQWNLCKEAEFNFWYCIQHIL